MKSMFSLKKLMPIAACAAMLVACSDDSSSSDDPLSPEEETSSSSNEPDDIVSISNKAISGVSQKGPFVTGSAVELYELDADFKQTGKSFTGKITTDDGSFKISSVDLASQYSLLKASGYYRNEVTGKKSNGTIVLNAITDLSKREQVNVNLLTHLEYERAMYLVGKGASVADAKKQAEKEILKAFGIEGDFESSEDLDIFSAGEGNAALLAISVLMQGALSEADLTERLTKFAADIEEDGTWEDKETKVKMADWALQAYVDGSLKQIIANINAWKLGEAPDFTGFVYKFWNDVYGIDACNKDAEGTVIAITEATSAHKGSDLRMICKDGSWVEASDFEKDTYGWEAPAADVYFKKGSVTGTQYIYDRKNKVWRLPNIIESINYEVARITLLSEGNSWTNACSEESEGLYVGVSLKVDGSIYCKYHAGNLVPVGEDEDVHYVQPCDFQAYQCKDYEWVEADFMKANAHLFEKALSSVSMANEDKDGYVTTISGFWYKYDAINGWELANKNDVKMWEIGTGACTEKQVGSLRFVYEEEIDWSDDNKFRFSDYYICTKSPTWIQWDNGVYSESDEYYYEWDQISGDEDVSEDTPCDDDHEGDIVSGSLTTNKYICTKSPITSSPDTYYHWWKKYEP